MQPYGNKYGKCKYQEKNSHNQQYCHIQRRLQTLLHGTSGKRGIQIEISVIDWKSVHNSVSAFPIAILVGGFPKSQALAGGIAPNIFYNRAILRAQAQAGVIIPVILRKLP